MNEKQNEQISGLTFRAFIISIILVVIATVWIGRSELITNACQISESVPPIPAVAGLLLLVLLNPVLNKISTKLRLNRAEVLVIYSVMTMAVSMSAVGVARVFFPFITVPYYYATPENQFDKLAEYIPSWVAPQNKEVIRMMYEGAPDGRVPWGDWAVPLMMWGMVFVTLFLTMFFILVIFRKQWIEKERLTFPLIYLPLELTQQSKSDPNSAVSDFLKSPVMWIGFGLALLYNVMNILNAVNPDFPAMGIYYNLGNVFTEQPWSAIKPLVIYYNPAILGFGYLVSLEVSMSVWLFYLLFRIEQVIGMGMGVQLNNYPLFYGPEQAIGGYIAFAIVLVLLARKHLVEVFKKAVFSDPEIDDSNEPVSYRVAFFGSIAGIIILCVILSMLHMKLWVVAAFIFMIITVAFVYARIRAETGIPMIWLFPMFYQKRILSYTVGVKTLLDQGMPNLVGLSVLTFLARGFFPQLTAYQLDTIKIAEEANIKRKQVLWIVVFSIIIGLAASWTLHLSMYYKYGANVLESGRTGGGTRATLAVNEYTELSTAVRSPQGPVPVKNVATAIGAATVAGLVILRRIFFNFPLNPIGYIVATAYGSPVWGPLFLVWIIKSIILKIGGVNMYKQLIPLFMGLAVGHFIVAGVIWGLIGAFNPDIARFYVVFFG